MAWRVRRAALVNVGSRLAQKLPRYLLPLCFASRLSLSLSLSSLFAAARFYNSTHRYLRQGVDSPLVVDLPTRGDASLAHRSRPACSKARLSHGSSGYTFSLCVCVRATKLLSWQPYWAEGSILRL